MRIQMDLFRSGDGRIEGTVRAPDGGGGPFTGVLDLLRVLEAIDLPALDDDPAATRDRGNDDG
ncbi:MAG: hypothetical protein J0I34_30225 [Pseudonocardia sp.]|uniref:hypothetical protein n=1 Tax=unclassified Pseudonocardia TaxID=2619320 RepID=UPI000868CC56|nr:MULTISPECIES: hypothetical protein [unclassified Pseudonocardia]MBN9113050.1 hypothetical protein [Pseudonocardia sp.]ODU24787.1 MAG: hypothetical protein ABS80_11490 [Pseudonocardia sp. SCN 72-51]ODV05524.1 MAG: hypothetical protein ABT15_16790 [Pseudonocardia sp. SCN 73-27]RTL66126.1 MAG: hypothetical protein EKK42_18415 [Pseudonocardiaceae bacterium]